MPERFAFSLLLLFLYNMLLPPNGLFSTIEIHGHNFIYYNLQVNQYCHSTPLGVKYLKYNQMFPGKPPHKQWRGDTFTSIMRMMPGQMLYLHSVDSTVNMSLSWQTVGLRDFFCFHFQIQKCHLVFTLFPAFKNLYNSENNKVAFIVF